ncbi:superoxide dismutase family protein [Fibrella aquatilis]|uniref:Superoxide dismutase family protein n=1 Tax=Fibrella aquatilis TaxID=2817059 RepID=A0A939JZJ6_9BACT|nr:superoxide dismutase family protein [Fibrella aquatilis]MBO0931478.1 superoxide dismutase family protein [Fibrella aquatilis]
MKRDINVNLLRFVALLALAIIGLLASCTSNDTTTVTSTIKATTSLIDTTGKAIGTATFTEETPGLVTMVVSVTGLKAGQHGIHFHMVGKAEPSTKFMSAGEHFNPDNKKHGLQSPTGAHNGDLPNLVVNAQGVGSLTTATDRITLGTGTKSVFDTDGTAIIIHANADDQLTDPSGNSGGRIAAGVLTRN